MHSEESNKSYVYGPWSDKNEPKIHPLKLMYEMLGTFFASLITSSQQNNSEKSIG